MIRHGPALHLMISESLCLMARSEAAKHWPNPADVLLLPMLYCATRQIDRFELCIHDLLCCDFMLLTDTTAISLFLCIRANLLAFEPLIHDLLCEVELGLPQTHPLLKGTNVGGGAHALSLHNLVIQQCLDVVQATQDVRASCTPLKSVKCHSCPVTLESAQGVGPKGIRRTSMLIVHKQLDKG